MKFSVKDFYILVNILVGFFTTNKLSIAQSIQTDGTTNTRPLSCSGNCTIRGGLEQGNNLFHSFERFNVDAGATVLFQDFGVTNILGRVTGGEMSEISGTLGIIGGNANLFLLNPNGIIFGPNSSLDINGSFLATTSDAIRFGEQGFLNAVREEIPLLTINPSALFFAQGNRKIISNESLAIAREDMFGRPTALGLTVPDGKSLLLIGGDVILNQSGVNAFGGRVELGGLTETGEIKLNISDIEDGNISLSFPDEVQRANVFLNNGAFVDVRSGNGGDIVINAENITISKASAVIAGIKIGLGTVDSQAGNITLNAVNHLDINSSSSADNSINPGAQGNGGNIIVNSGSLSISDRSIIQASTFAQGDAGNIQINVPNGLIEIKDESQITAEVNSLILDSFQSIAIGKRGEIKIIAQEILLEDISNISTSTFGQGDAGNIDIFVKEGINISFNSSISSRVAKDASGLGGDIEVTTAKLNIQEGAEINVSAEGNGNAGSLTINAQEIILDRGTFSAETRTGDKGSITLNDLNSLRLLNGSQISAKATDDATGGNIKIGIDGNLTLEGNNNLISAQATKRADGGNVEIDANFVIAFPQNNDIVASAQQGNGGKIKMTAESLFGIEERKSTLPNTTNDIDASSDFGFDGSISIETPDVDPASGLVELPDVPVDVSALLARNICDIGRGKTGKNSSFINTGRGGLPPNPYESLDSSDIFVDVQLPTEWRENSAHNSSVTKPIVEATAWVVNEKGNVELVSKLASKNLRCR